MADWNTPTLTSTYTSVLDTFKNRDVDLAVMFNPTYASALTNVPTGAVRWNPTGATWELYNGTSWGALATLHNINVDKLDGQDGSYYRAYGNLTGVPTSFTPSAHTHDDRYYTETESDARYGNNLFVSGNTVQLRTAGGTALTTITVPYAVSAGQASTSGAFQVGQDLLTTSSATFNAATITTELSALGGLLVGKATQPLSTVGFYDTVGSVYRYIRYNSGAVERWQVEHTDGTYKNIFHEAHVPDWTEVANKPTNFTPTAHGHVFDQTTKLQVHRAATATLDALTGQQGEVAFDTSTGRLRAFNGALAGGFPVALQSELANYAPINVIPAGTTLTFAQGTAPSGWLKANGAAVSRTAYATLFAAIGTQFGAGDGSTTFNVPDMRGVVARGLDDGRGLDVSRVLGTYQADQFQDHGHVGGNTGYVSNDHSHYVNLNTNNAGSHSHTAGTNATGSTNGPSSGSNGTQYGTSTSPNTTSTAGDHAHNVQGSTGGISANHYHGFTVGAANSGSPGAETRVKNVALLYCIKF